jgi:hypothetical protein
MNAEEVVDREGPLLEWAAAGLWSEEVIVMRACGYFGSCVTAFASGTLSLPIIASVALADIGWGLGIGAPSRRAAAARRALKEKPNRVAAPIGLFEALSSFRSTSRQKAADARRRIGQKAAALGATAIVASPLALIPGSFATSGETIAFMASLFAAGTLAPALLHAGTQAKAMIGIDHGMAVDDTSIDRLSSLLDDLAGIMAADPPRISSIRSTGRTIATLLRTRILPTMPLSSLAPYAPGLSKDAYVDILRDGIPGLRAHLSDVIEGAATTSTFESVLANPMGAMRALMLDDGDDDPAWRVVRDGVVSDRRTTANAATVYERAKRIQQICEMALAADPELQDGDGGRVQPLISEHLPRLLRSHEEAIASSSTDHDARSDRMLIEGVEIVRSAVEDALSRSGAAKRDSLATELRFLQLRHPSSAERIAA